MNTLHLYANNPQDVARAGELLGCGGVVAIPTETVYGLGANALDEKAVEKIFFAKGRPADNPLIVHIASIDDLNILCAEISDNAGKLAEAFWPGPLTLIMKKAPIVPHIVSAGLDTVGVRMPGHKGALGAIAAAKVPVAAPSANLSGTPSSTSAEAVLADFGGKIDAVLDGGPSPLGLESTVINMCTNPPQILRPGAITRGQIEEIIGPIGQKNELARGEAPASPGMKYRHYATKAPITLLLGSPKDGADFLQQAGDKAAAAITFDEYLAALSPVFGPKLHSLGQSWDIETQSRRLYGLLREIDGTDAQKIYIQAPRMSEKSAALLDRLTRAANRDIIKLSTRQIVGVTGRSGSGKSIFSRHLAERYGALTLDADGIYGRLLLESDEMKGAIFSAFPQCKNREEIDRKALGSAVFGNPAALQALNAVTHPHVKADMEAQIGASHAPLIILDVPVLFGSGIDLICTSTVGITAKNEGAMARIQARDGISRERAAARLAAQEADGFFYSRCDTIIENFGHLQDFLQKIDAFASNLKGEKL